MSMIEVAVPVQVTDTDIEEIVITAIEGGIGYWGRIDNMSDTFLNAPGDEPVSVTAACVLLEGGGVIFIDVEDPAVSWVLTKQNFLEGLGKFLNSENGWDLVERGLIDTTRIDADDADTIIQYALFGEQVYG